MNAEGGVNGRKITFISYDDNYSPPKTSTCAKAGREDEVLLIVVPGTAQNTAIQKYLNGKKVPQLFVATGDPVERSGELPMDDGMAPSSQSEAPSSPATR